MKRFFIILPLLFCIIYCTNSYEKINYKGKKIEVKSSEYYKNKLMSIVLANPTILNINNNKITFNGTVDFYYENENIKKGYLEKDTKIKINNNSFMFKKGTAIIEEETFLDFYYITFSPDGNISAGFLKENTLIRIDNKVLKLNEGLIKNIVFGPVINTTFHNSGNLKSSYLAEDVTFEINKNTINIKSNLKADYPNIEFYNNENLKSCFYSPDTKIKINGKDFYFSSYGKAWSIKLKDKNIEYDNLFFYNNGSVEKGLLSKDVEVNFKGTKQIIPKDHFVYFNEKGELINYTKKLGEYRP